MTNSSKNSFLSRSLAPKLAIALISLMLISIVSLQLHANDDRFYQVDLVVFEHLNQSASPEGEQRLDIESDYPTLESFKLIEPDQYALTDDAKKIRGSRNFRLVKHFAWSQQGLPKEEAGSISIGRWVPGIEGTVTMYLSRYLHLDLSLIKTNTESPNNILKTRRRLRSNETHYIDHPEFGILVRITPVEDTTELINN